MSFGLTRHIYHGSYGELCLWFGLRFVLSTWALSRTAAGKEIVLDPPVRGDDSVEERGNLDSADLSPYNPEPMQHKEKAVETIKPLP